MTGRGRRVHLDDSLGRLTASTNGDAQLVGYGYDLDGQVTSLTYPNTKVVTASL